MNYLIYDFGEASEHAVKLARDGNSVRYFTPFAGVSPQFVNYSLGLGLEKIEKVKDFFDNIDWADVIMFPDVQAADLAGYLKHKGYNVFGSDSAGAKLEQTRFETRQLQYRLGIPTQKTIKVNGVEGIRKYLFGELQRGDFEFIEGQEGIREFLKQKGDVFIKLDRFRGDIESFYAKDYDSVEMILDKIEMDLGPFKDAYHFIIEEKLEGIEPGFDLFFNGTEFLKPYLWGYEYHKGVYIGIYTDEMPYPLRFIADKLAPYLKKINYRGALSIEAIIDKKGRPFLIDICARFPYPLSLIFTESLKNYSEIINGISQGINPLKLDVAGKYIGCLPVKSAYYNKYWEKLSFDPKLRIGNPSIKLQENAFINGNYYSVKGANDIVATFVSYGDTIDEVVNKLYDISEKFDCHGLNSVAKGELEKIQKEVIREGNKKGLTF
jgi:phosphoribosylamine-glycine ligase